MNKEKRAKVTSTDDVRKLLIKSVVQRSRRVLVEGLEQRLASLGIFKTGTRLEVSTLPDQWEAQRERPAIDAALARWESQRFDQAAAVDRFTRECSYTWLNRLAAIRALEVRGLIRPIASLDKASSRPSIVANLAEISPVLAQAREVAEPLLWQQVFDELALELGALFDPHDPHGQVFPGSNALVETLTIFEELTPEIWGDDDTLGWFYQFFTTKDERAQLRKKKGAAFTADDLGPINQFFTPGWIVRFLVDNTLGALWRRIAPQSRIADFCTLLLPATDDDTPRAPKRVRELRIIDPACGAMHFGVYTFDVLSFMYEEEGIEDRRDVPRLIIEENLVGIDIDRRAIQIAALNLYLKAATALSAMGEEQPANLRMNLACADAAPPAAEHVRTMRESIADPLLRDAFDVAITSLKSLHAVGSLLDPEADVRAALQARSLKRPAGVSPLPGLLAQLGMVEDEHPTQIEAIVTAARELAERALRADDIPGALAAEDALLAANVLRFVSQRYDVVLMNPPYGELMPPATKTYLHQRYPRSKSDIYGAFFELAFRLAEGGGAIGALTSKTFLYLDTFRHIRSLFLDAGRMSALIDGGDRVLFESDVDVSAVAGWAEPASKSSEARVFRLVREGDREGVLNNVAAALRDDNLPRHDVLYQPRLADLRRLPTQTIAYWAPPAVIRAYEQYPPLEPAYGEVRQGLATGDDERFLRYWWEVPANNIGKGERWIPYAKGGDFSPFYENTLRVTDWKDNGAEIKASPAARPQNQQYYFREGITYPHIADRFHARHLPAGSIFGSQGSAIITSGNYLPLLTFLNSTVAQALLAAQSPSRAFEVGQLKRLPVPTFSVDERDALAAIGQRALAAAHRFATGDELDKRFECSWAEQSALTSLPKALDFAISCREEYLAVISAAQADATAFIANIVDFREADWAQIDRTFGPEIGEDKRLRVRGFRANAVDDPLLHHHEQGARLISSLISAALATAPIRSIEDTTTHVTEALLRLFPTGDAIRELSSIMAMSPETWISEHFHQYHLLLRRGRPSIVRLTGAMNRVRIFANALTLTANDIRTYLSKTLSPLERSSRSMVASSNSRERVLHQEFVEDAIQVRTLLDDFLTVWDDDIGDVRPRIGLFGEIAPYLSKGRKSDG